MAGPVRLDLHRRRQLGEAGRDAAGKVRRIGVVAAVDLEHRVHHEAADAKPERRIGVLRRDRRPARRAVGGPIRLGVGVALLDLLRGAVTVGELRRAGLRRRRRRQRMRLARQRRLFLLLGARAGGIKAGVAGAGRRHDVGGDRLGLGPGARARAGRRRPEALQVLRIAQRRRERRRRLRAALRDRQAHARTPPPALRAREQDAGGDGAAEAGLRGTMRRAGARPPFSGRAKAGWRPPPGGRWLTGSKDLWLTGPLRP